MLLSGWRVPIEQLSASSISLLVTCPEAWRQRRILKVPDSTGPDKFAGIIDHAAAAVNFSQKMTTLTDLPITKMDGIYDDCWSAQIENNGEPDWDTTDPEKIREKGKVMTRLYHERVSPSVLPIRVEERFSLEIPEVPIPLVGYVDIETRETVVERKTTKTRMSKPKPNWLMQWDAFIR